jgi:DNA-binding GntR family transcriptional regulator
MSVVSSPYSEAIYQELRQEILSGKVRPGERLTEIDIAQRMGTSQGPVREAFTRLREHGLLISFRHRGSYVSEISEEDARDAYQVRAVLERQAMMRALPRMGPREFAALELQVKSMEAAATRQDLVENLANDMRFHRLIFEWSGSPMLLQCWDLIEVKIRKFAIVASPPVFADPVGPVRSHYPLLERMREGYSPALEAELERHLAVIWRRSPNPDEDTSDPDQTADDTAG